MSASRVINGIAFSLISIFSSCQSKILSRNEHLCQKGVLDLAVGRQNVRISYFFLLKPNFFNFDRNKLRKYEGKPHRRPAK